MSMLPKYKLTSFNARYLAENIRLVFAQADVEYQDIRINKEQWKDLKPTTPFGKLPILEFDGIMISETRAIARYLARENGLTGKDNIEAAQCDMLVDAFYDLFTGLYNWVDATNDAVKATNFLAFATDMVPPFMEFLTKILEQNKGGVGFLVGDQLTWADITVAHGLNTIDILGPAHGCQIFHKFPLLMSYVERILELPKIAAWIKERPSTEH